MCLQKLFQVIIYNVRL